MAIYQKFAQKRAPKLERVFWDLGFLYSELRCLWVFLVEFVRVEFQLVEYN